MAGRLKISDISARVSDIEEQLETLKRNFFWSRVTSVIVTTTIAVWVYTLS